MATEYRLSYTASEIDTKLATVDEINASIEAKADLVDGKVPVEQLPDDILKEGELAEAINTALLQAKESGEFDGEKGDKGDTGADGKDYVLTSADKNEIAEMVGGVNVPDYWVSELETKADTIQQAMEDAGRNKSAFLWYTDAHWETNSKMSPVLLKYLVENTPMNKINFGGDIINDPSSFTHDNVKYAYDWRSRIADLPNHHSVYGNHDLNHWSTDVSNIAYALLLAPEETAEMVVGGDSYYYIDNQSEKTRYLHLSYLTSDHDEMTAQGEFIVSALKSVPEGWHIVAIAHRWWQYDSSKTPTVGAVPNYEKEILSIFDSYNARETRTSSNYFAAQDFADAKGKVEFCIGGHIHIDHDFASEGGIPIIITASDTNQERSSSDTEDSGTVGTITESAIFGIIADYSDVENIKITVVGVGRGTSRIVRSSSVKPTSISNITYSGDTTVGTSIDKSKFSFTVNYNNDTTDTITGATSVSPTTIEVVGDNAVIISYTEGIVTVSETVIIVGKAKPVVNLFDKTDPDMLDRGRINSSHVAVAYADNQLVTGYIEAKVGDTFTINTDLANNANNYVGAAYCWDENKSYVGGNMERAVTAWVWNSDYTEGTFTIPEEYRFNSENIANFEGTAYVRFCLAYTDMDNIVITKE